MHWPTHTRTIGRAFRARAIFRVEFGWVWNGREPVRTTRVYDTTGYRRGDERRKRIRNTAFPLRTETWDPHGCLSIFFPTLLIYIWKKRFEWATVEIPKLTLAEIEIAKRELGENTIVLYVYFISVLFNAKY